MKKHLFLLVLLFPCLLKAMDPLLKAALDGDSVQVQTLISSNNYAMLSDKKVLVKALHAAVAKNNLNSVQFLLFIGVPVDASIDGWTALHYALLHERAEVLEVLLKSGANITKIIPEDTSTPLHMAVRSNNIKLILPILRAAFSQNLSYEVVNAKDAHKLSPLHYAVTLGASACISIQLLLRSGADVSVIVRKDHQAYTLFDYVPSSQVDKDSVVNCIKTTLLKMLKARLAEKRA
ncbi:ankyrin repeat domain-containing protein [Candidatus Dependentiae bacterium]|nr:ankyrin repeat domain-containing protein [Candidatus Dependentiae bacterium]